MSHALDFSRGKAAVAYNAKNGKPWHGLGAAKPEDANWTLDDWVENAGLNFKVKKAPAIYQVPNPLFPTSGVPLPEGWTNKFGVIRDENKVIIPEMLTRSYENRAVLYRDDTLDALSVMSESHYTPAQPRDLLAGLFQLTENSGYEMDVAGALKGGKVVWALAKRTDEQGEIAGDVVLPYVLLLNSFDGTYARTGRLTSIRVVCQNTVSLSAVTDAATTAKQRNSAEFSLEKANLLLDALGQFDASFQQYLDAGRTMAATRMTDETLKRFFAKLYAPEAFKDAEAWKTSPIDWDAPKVTSNARNNVATLHELFRDSPGASLPSADGTLWGAVNAVTFYQDHAARTKGDKRWESATLGQGNRAKDGAMMLAMDLIGSN